MIWYTAKFKLLQDYQWVIAKTANSETSMLRNK